MMFQLFTGLCLGLPVARRGGGERHQNCVDLTGNGQRAQTSAFEGQDRRLEETLYVVNRRMFVSFRIDANRSASRPPGNKKATNAPTLIALCLAFRPSLF